MNQDIIKGNWQQVKGKIKQQWGKITDDKITKMNGTYEELSGLLQQTYGLQREEAKKQLDAFIKANNWTEH